MTWTSVAWSEYGHIYTFSAKTLWPITTSSTLGWLSYILHLTFTRNLEKCWHGFWGILDALAYIKPMMVIDWLMFLRLIVTEPSVPDCFNSVNNVNHFLRSQSIILDPKTTLWLLAHHLRPIFGFVFQITDWIVESEQGICGLWWILGSTRNLLQISSTIQQTISRYKKTWQICTYNNF